MSGDPVTWKLMGIVTALLSALGCGPASKKPVLADYDVALYPQRALRIDPAVTANGRFEIVAGDKLVLELQAAAGGSRIAYDRGSDWRVVLELPPNADPTRPLEISLDGVPAIARVAGEDVVYLARRAKGRVKLARQVDPVSGEIEVVFEAPDRDFIKLGPYRLSGSFRAKLK
jgi:hypothetical protein